MRTNRKALIILIGLLLAVQVFCVSTVAAQEGSADSKDIERLERLIKEQQQQLESLQQQVKELKQTATEAQTQAEEAKSEASQAKTAVEAKITELGVGRNPVYSSSDKVKLAI